MKENKLTLRLVLRALGLLFSIVPPALAILFYFPVWIQRGGEYVLSGFAVLLMLVAFLPLFKLLRQALRSPSGYTIWLALFVIFLLVSRIADEMIVISFVGLIGNIIGALLFRLSERYKNEE